MISDFVPYLGFDGDCKQAFEFYEKALGGKILMMMRHGDGPPEVPKSPKTDDRIMHARLQVGNRFLMGGDAPPDHFSRPQGFCVALQTDDAAEADRTFAALAEGGQVNMPIGKTFWAERFGMLIDKFGVPWMVNCEASA